MPITTAQRIEFLNRANSARLGIAKVRAEVASGELPVSRALWDPRGQSMTLFALLMSQRNWGRKRTRRLLLGLHIAETKRLSALTERQRRLIADQTG